MALVNQVRRLRLQAGTLTQEDLARQVGVTRQTIISIERGRYNPSVELALKLARTFGVRVEELFTLEEEDPA